MPNFAFVLELYSILLVLSKRPLNSFNPFESFVRLLTSYVLFFLFFAFASFGMKSLIQLKCHKYSIWFIFQSIILQIKLFLNEMTTVFMYY